MRRWVVPRLRPSGLLRTSVVSGGSVPSASQRQRVQKLSSSSCAKRKVGSLSCGFLTMLQRLKSMLSNPSDRHGRCKHHHWRMASALIVREKEMPSSTSGSRLRIGTSAYLPCRYRHHIASGLEGPHDGRVVLWKRVSVSGLDSQARLQDRWLARRQGFGVDPLASRAIASQPRCIMSIGRSSMPFDFERARRLQRATSDDARGRPLRDGEPTQRFRLCQDNRIFRQSLDAGLGICAPESLWGDEYCARQWHQRRRTKSISGA